MSVLCFLSQYFNGAVIFSACLPSSPEGYAGQVIFEQKLLISELETHYVNFKFMVEHFLVSVQKLNLEIRELLQTTPWILGPSSPTKSEKNLILALRIDSS